MSRSPPGSRGSSARKRQLPVLPNNNNSLMLGGTSPSHSSAHSHQTSRRASLSMAAKNNASQLIVASSDDQLLNLPPSSPSSRHSQSKAPIMQVDGARTRFENIPSLYVCPSLFPIDCKIQSFSRSSTIGSFLSANLQQLHNQTLKVPSGDDQDPTLLPSDSGDGHNRHPKLNQLAKNSSQEENIDPQLGGEPGPSAGEGSRHSRSSSQRRSTMRKPSASLSRSSEPATDGDLMLLVPNSSESRHHRKIRYRGVFQSKHPNWIPFCLFSQQIPSSIHVMKHICKLRSVTWIGKATKYWKLQLTFGRICEKECHAEEKTQWT